MNNEEPTTSVRRVSARDRKSRLEPVEPLFQETERFPPVAPARQAAAKPVRKTLPRPVRRGFTRYDAVALVFMLGTIAAVIYFVFLWQDPYSAINPLAPPTPLPIYVTATPPPITGERFQPVDVLYGTYSGGAGCEQRYIAGNVQPGLEIRVRGENVEASALAGSALLYGAGGFEIPLPDAATSYEVQLFDRENTPRSDPTVVTISESCELNLAVVTFVVED